MPGSRHFSKPKCFFFQYQFFFPLNRIRFEANRDILEATRQSCKKSLMITMWWRLQARKKWVLDWGSSSLRRGGRSWIYTHPGCQSPARFNPNLNLDLPLVSTYCSLECWRHIVPKTIRLGCPETFEWTVKFYFFPRLLCVFGDLMTTNLFRDGISSAKVFTRFGQEISNCWEPITKLPNLKRRPVLELSSWWSKWTPNVLGIPSVK